MEDFTQALHVTHVYDQNTPASQRLAAEEYLMQLRNSSEGLNLSFHIITQEPVNEIRYFWSFNTIIQHISSLANALDAAQADELLDTLLSFCYRVFAAATTTDAADSGRGDDVIRSRGDAVVVLPHAANRDTADHGDSAEMHAAHCAGPVGTGNHHGVHHDSPACGGGSGLAHAATTGAVSAASALWGLPSPMREGGSAGGHTNPSSSMSGANGAMYTSSSSCNTNGNYDNNSNNANANNLASAMHVDGASRGHDSNSRACATTPADFLLNKHAQLMVTGLRAFYPARWQSFFDKLHHLVQAGRLCHSQCIRNTITVYVLRVYQYVDEVIVCGREHSRDGVRSRDMEIKDAMRMGSVVEQAVSLWYSILVHYSYTNNANNANNNNNEDEGDSSSRSNNNNNGNHNNNNQDERNCSEVDYSRTFRDAGTRGRERCSNCMRASNAVDTAKLCLNVVYSYAEWIDIRLLITADWVGLVCYVLTIAPLRTEACEVLCSLVQKKQMPGAKMASLRALAVREVVPRLVEMLEQSAGCARAGGGNDSNNNNNNDSRMEQSAHGLMPQPASVAAMSNNIENSVREQLCTTHRRVWSEDELAFATAVTRLSVATAEQFLQLLETCSNNNNTTIIATNTSTTTNNNSRNSQYGAEGAVMQDDWSMHASGMNSVVYDVPFVMTSELMQLLAEALHDTVSELIRLMSLGVDDIHEEILPFVQTYLKSSALHASEATALLEAMIDQIVRLALDESESSVRTPAEVEEEKVVHDTCSWDKHDSRTRRRLPMSTRSTSSTGTAQTVTIEPDDASAHAQRKLLYNLIRLLYRRFDDVVLRHLESLIVAVTSTNWPSGHSLPSQWLLNTTTTNNNNDNIATNMWCDESGCSEDASLSAGCVRLTRLTQRLFRMPNIASAAQAVRLSFAAESNWTASSAEENRDEQVGGVNGACAGAMRMATYAETSASCLWGMNGRYATAVDESVLRYLYEMGEAVRLERLRDAEDRFTCLFIRVLNSDRVAQHRSARVHVALFDLMDRYYLVFLAHRCHIPTLLHRLLLLPCGVVNRCDAARGRVCYVLNHLVNVLKPCLLPFAADVVRALQTILYTTAHLLPSDRQQLYEAMGSLLRILLHSIQSGPIQGSAADTTHTNDNNDRSNSRDESSGGATRDTRGCERNGWTDSETPESAAYRSEQRRECLSLVHEVVGMAANYLMQQQHNSSRNNTSSDNSHGNNQVNGIHAPVHGRAGHSTMLREGEAVAIAISYFTSLIKGLGAAVTSSSNSSNSSTSSPRGHGESHAHRSSASHASSRASSHCELAEASRYTTSQTGDDATRTRDNSNNNTNSNRGNNNNSNSSSNSNNSSSSSTNQPEVDLMHDLFLRVTHEVITAAEVWASTSVAVREAAGQYFHQLVNHMPFELICSHVQRYIVAALYSMSTVPELSRLLRLVYQTIQRTGSRACGLLTRVLPLLWQKVSLVGQLAEANPLVCMDVISESARERIDVYRQLFVLLASAASHGCGRALWQLHGIPPGGCYVDVSRESMGNASAVDARSPECARLLPLQQTNKCETAADCEAAAAAAAATRRGCLEKIFGQLLEALRLPADLELPRMALQVFTHLVADCAATMRVAVREGNPNEQQAQEKSTSRYDDGASVQQGDVGSHVFRENKTLSGANLAGDGGGSHTHGQQQTPQPTSHEGQPGSGEHRHMGLCDQDAANDYADTRDFVHYVLHTVLPTAVQTLLLNPQFNPRDAKNFMLLGEWIVLSKSVVQLCGDTALQMLYTELGGRVVGEEQAMQFCLLLRDTPQVTTSLKIQLRNILEQRRVMQNGAY